MKMLLTLACLFSASFAHADQTSQKLACLGIQPICQFVQDGTGFSVFVGDDKIVGPVSYEESIRVLEILKIKNGICK